MDQENIRLSMAHSSSLVTAAPTRPARVASGGAVIDDFNREIAMNRAELDMEVEHQCTDILEHGIQALQAFE